MGREDTPQVAFQTPMGPSDRTGVLPSCGNRLPPPQLAPRAGNAYAPRVTIGDVAPIAEEYVQRLLHETDPLEAVTILSARWSVRARATEPSFGLSKPEYQVTMVLIYTGEVGNGGHTQFFSNRGGEIVSPVRDALREIGLVELDTILGEAVALFPGGRVPADREEVDRLWESWDERQLGKFGDLDARAWRQPDVDRRLLDYLRQHQTEVLRPERGLLERPAV